MPNRLWRLLRRDLTRDLRARDNKQLLRIAPELAALPLEERLRIQAEALRRGGRERAYRIGDYLVAVVLLILLCLGTEMNLLFPQTQSGDEKDQQLRSATLAYNAMIKAHPTRNLAPLPLPTQAEIKTPLRYIAPWLAPDFGTLYVIVGGVSWLWLIITCLWISRLRLALYAAPHVDQLLTERKQKTSAT